MSACAAAGLSVQARPCCGPCHASLSPPEPVAADNGSPQSWPAGGAGTAMAENGGGCCLSVMAGRVPAICTATVGVDGRDTPGHDGRETTLLRQIPYPDTCGAWPAHDESEMICLSCHLTLAQAVITEWFGPDPSMRPDGAQWNTRPQHITTHEVGFAPILSGFRPTCQILISDPLAAVNVHLGPAEIQRLARTQEEQQVRHLARLAQPAHRDFPLHDLLGARRQDRRVDLAR